MHSCQEWRYQGAPIIAILAEILSRVLVGPGVYIGRTSDSGHPRTYASQIQNTRTTIGTLQNISRALPGRPEQISVLMRASRKKREALLPAAFRKY